MYITLATIRGASYNRKLMGEELQELNMKELQELEKLLGSGLRRVRDAKVCFSLSLVDLLIFVAFRNSSTYPCI